MSEVQSRPSARGRGSARAGRGGFSSRGGRGGRAHANGENVIAPVEDDGEEAQLKKQYGSKVNTIQELFLDWTIFDIGSALEQCDGDLELTVERITEGSISQWGEVSKAKKDRSKSKVKDNSNTAFTDVTNQSKSLRGGRAGFDNSSGGPGRGIDRVGRGGRSRGGSTTHTNGFRNKENTEASVPTVESTAWDTAPTDDTWDTVKSSDDWGATTSNDPPAAPPAKPTSSIIPDGVKKSWASMFAPPPAPKKAPEPVEKPIEPAKPEEPTLEPTLEIEVSDVSQPAAALPSEAAPIQTPPFEEPAASITPSKDELTETNLEQLPDTSHPVQTATAASTAASSWDPRSVSGNMTPYSTLQHQGSTQSVRPPTSGYQASALKATGASGRSSSFQRRILDQEEAVRMPGNREVDRAAVQFGAFNLNGTGEDDVDGDREEPETRAQPPQHSPVAHPRAALPPAQPVQPVQPAPASEGLPTPKVASGLPAVSQPTAAPGLPSPQSIPQAQTASQQGAQGNGQFSQYGRFGQSGTQEQPSSLPQKPYDPFSQQAPTTQSPFEGYQGQQNQAQPQAQTGAFSSAPADYSSYYTADPQQRQAYSQCYQQQYALQQSGQGQQDASANQQRAFSGYNGPQAEGSQYPQAQSSGQQSQARYATAGESQTSGHSTPNQAGQTQQATSQSGQPQPSHPQQPQNAFPYGHPYYSSPYYAAYMNQFQGYGGAGNFAGGPYGAKGGVHNQPYQGYAMSPNAPYEHASSPAAGGGFAGSSLHARDNALGGGLGDYGRANSAQSPHGPQGMGGSSAFGNTHDAIGRCGSYQGQNQHYGGQGNQPGVGDDLKPFGDSKTTNGPSPSITQAGRPGSAANTAPGSVLPQPQSQQGGYGGYPAHLQQQDHGLHGSQAASQYSGLGGIGGHQAAGQGHQSSPYGGYQGFGGNNYYGSSQQRGGWGGNYGH